MKNLSIIGGGVAALMLATQIDTQKYKVRLIEKKKSVGRKFLLAGKGGLNITHSSSVDEMLSQYEPSEFLKPIIRQFSNQDLVNWLEKIDIPTFVGSSNRVYADYKRKPIEVLNIIVEQIKDNNVEIITDTTWTGWNKEGYLCFNKPLNLESDIVIFALGGSTWKITGSDGKWLSLFQERGINVLPFRPANCAFSVDWNFKFINTYEGKPLKNIILNFDNSSSKGELVITKFGLEGNAIYALSQKIQNKLLTESFAVIYIDLKPSLSIEQIKNKLTESKRKKLTDILIKDLNLNRCMVGLLKQFTDKHTFLDKNKLAEAIKSLPIKINKAEELDKAISSLGGIALDEIDTHFQLNKMPNTYAIGEMLDWFAPTGGYLLQANFSMGFALAKHLNKL